MSFAARQRFTLQLIGALVLALVVSGGSALKGAALQATPGTTTASCDVEPLSIEKLRELAATPDVSRGEFLTWPTLPVGDPADPATEGAINAVVRQFEACTNAQDDLRWLALLSDNFLAGMVSEETIAELAATPTPIPEDKRLVVTGPWDVQILADGRVSAAVIYDDAGNLYPDMTRVKLLLFVERNGRWFIDEMIDRVMIEGRNDDDFENLRPLGEVVPFPPAMPSPRELCAADPRPVAELRGLAAAPTPVPPPRPPPLPVGNPADAATRQAIDLAVREIEACINAGDLARLYALFSDEFILDGEAVDEGRLAFLDDTAPQPRLRGDRALFIGPWATQALEDGRVMAAVRLGNAREFYPDGDETRLLLFVNRDGRWLLDEIISVVSVEGRRKPRPVSGIFGTPLQTPYDER